VIKIDATAGQGPTFREVHLELPDYTGNDTVVSIVEKLIDAFPTDSITVEGYGTPGASPTALSRVQDG
jgi:3-hydroxyacyl-CoA dehydrogenase